MATKFIINISMMHSTELLKKLKKFESDGNDDYKVDVTIYYVCFEEKCQKFGKVKQKVKVGHFLQGFELNDARYIQKC